MLEPIKDGMNRATANDRKDSTSRPKDATNPAGRRKADPEAVRILKAAVPDCARALVSMATDETMNPRVRCMAAEAILNRVYGKAVQPIEATVGGNGDPVVIAFMGILDQWSK